MNRFRIARTPVGEYRVVVDSRDRLVGIYLIGQRHEPDAGLFGDLDDTAAAGVIGQLGEYFAGRRRSFDVELAPRGTGFQREVWAGLRQIGYGQTASYGELARDIGRPRACRAVGAATGRNPWSIIVPCHRLIGGDGSLTGYASGLSIKRRLLALEAAVLAGRPVDTALA
mgnify:CR=1 FL=1